MGKHLFTIAAPVPMLIWGILVFILAPLGGGLRYLTISDPTEYMSYWGYRAPLGAVLVLVGVSMCFVWVRTAFHRTEIYEEGLVQKDLGKSLVVIRFADVSSVARSADLIESAHLWWVKATVATADGRRIAVAGPTSAFSKDYWVDHVVRRASNAVAERMLHDIDAGGQVTWLSNGRLPVVKISADGLLLPRGQFVPFQSLEDRLADGKWFVSVDGKCVFSTTWWQWNFDAGLEVVNRLRKRSKSGEAT